MHFSADWLIEHEVKSEQKHKFMHIFSRKRQKNPKTYRKLVYLYCLWTWMYLKFTDHSIQVWTCFSLYLYRSGPAWWHMCQWGYPTVSGFGLQPAAACVYFLIQCIHADSWEEVSPQISLHWGTCGNCNYTSLQTASIIILYVTQCYDSVGFAVVFGLRPKMNQPTRKDKTWHFVK